MVEPLVLPDIQVEQHIIQVEQHIIQVERHGGEKNRSKNLKNFTKSNLIKLLIYYLEFN